MQKKQKEQYEIMKKRIKYMYEKGEDGYVEAIFSAASFADFLSRSEYVQKISEYDANIFKEYSDIIPCKRLRCQKNDAIMIRHYH